MPRPHDPELLCRVNQRLARESLVCVRTPEHLFGYGDLIVRRVPTGAIERRNVKLDLLAFELGIGQVADLFPGQS